MTIEAARHNLEHLLSLQDYVLDQGRGYLAQFDVNDRVVSRTHPHGVNFSLALLGPQGTQLLVFKNASPSDPIPAEHFPARRFDYNPLRRQVRSTGKLCTYSSVTDLLMDFFTGIDHILHMKGRANDSDRPGQETLRSHLQKIAQGGTWKKPNIWFPSDTALQSILTETACDLLRTIRDRQPRSIAELSEISGHNYATVRRILNSLKNHQLIELLCAEGRVQAIDTSGWYSIGVAAHADSRQLV